MNKPISLSLSIASCNRIRQVYFHHRPVQVDIPNTTLPTYLFDEIDNNIGATSCSYLSQVNMDGI